MNGSSILTGARLSKRAGLLIVCLVPLWACALAGLTNAQRTAAWLAYNNKEYSKALDLFTEGGDDSGMGLVYLALHQTDEAATAFGRAGDLRGLGMTAIQRRRYTEALDLFQQAGDDSGRGLAYIALRRLEDARNAFIKANDWSGLGLVSLEERQPVQARRFFNQVGDQRGLGLADLHERQIAAAALHFEQAQDDSGKALLALAEGRIEVAQAIALKSNDLSLLGACYLARQQLEEAETAFAAVNDWNGLGDVYSRGRQFAKARDAFARAHNPVKVIQSFRNDWRLGDTKRLEQAIAYGQKAIDEGHMVPECLCEMADVYYELGKKAEALAALDQASTHRGFGSEAALRRGRIYFYLRNYEKAREEFASINGAEVGDLAQQAARESLAALDRYRDLNIESAPSF